MQNPVEMKNNNKLTDIAIVQVICRMLFQPVENRKFG
jgi:hypothetical protein